ncbi:Transcriptional regulator containing an amidase domain and an AraC-type DNA-binding HTH domain [Alloactinosynnema sp. L-07]|uniref:GlxA family transcriptional regulator n=1 Tax=Alloactinosynnema sp. L-07 TaxID=1653480 RepID=UPI00065EF675|nr:GlxA family transcriptional regulator [Alloactinosynnema sp. L-07]CRK62194.1 Transcriptional regulator containing an amidase domain and an AraC-type DNA-binding HTH domain [Alloactinosynnema sp. L-07]
MHHVVVLVYPGIQLIDAVGPAEVFAGARSFGADYELTVASLDGAPVRSESGLSLCADRAVADVDRADTLLVAGGLGFRAACGPAAVAEVRRLAERAQRVCSVCSGAFVLAEAGLLNGRRVTTHWAAGTELGRAYPEVTVEPDRIFVRDGAVYTSAGVTAGMDLALALVEADHGVKIARTIARWLVMFLQRPGGQSQFSTRLEHPVGAGSPLRPVLDEIAADPAADHRVPSLARRVGVSERHLGRLFADQLGTTPARFVERVRVEAARGLLEDSVITVAAVSKRSGFGSPETLRRAFVRVLGVGPDDYRARFRTTERN